MGRMRTNWGKSLQEAGKEQYPLEHREDMDLWLFQTKDRISADENDPFLHPAPMYHVWFGDDWLYCGADMQKAYTKYQNVIDGKCRYTDRL